MIRTNLHNKKMVHSAIVPIVYPFIVIFLINHMKAAVVQFKASTNKENNLKKIISYISKAASKNASLCAFPEFMMFYTNSSQTPKQLADLSETINGNFVTSIAKAAKENHIQVVGSFYEKSRKKGRVYDTCFVIDKSGKVIDRKSTRLNSSHVRTSRMPSSA